VRLAVAGVMAAAVVAAAPAAGQTTSAPGPWVVDVRAATSGVPNDVSFYPTLTSAFVPARGYGIDLGGHVYVFTLGPARVGLGASMMIIRSSGSAPAATEDPVPTQGVTLTLRTVAPRISFNFGSREGWSYLSAGAGVASVTTRTEEVSPGRRESGQLRSLNVGGGARWFITPRMAFGFDVRAHRVAGAGGSNPTPPWTVMAIGAGLSLR
jgi:hypothetical protein